jgi:glycosyltransferase involved in cell wall biosynthesis
VISAPHPSDDVFKHWIAPLGPDIILAQALDSEHQFQKCGYHTAFLPNGVDIDRFVPVDEETKLDLRQKYGIGRQFVILHVGPLKRGRNVQLLGQLQRDDRQVLILGRPSDPGEERIVKALEQRGCLIWSSYQENIQEIYALSDCYAFPTIERRYCIETPLSVLEAMACNLPVVSTPFGALPRIVSAGEGIVYSQTPKSFAKAIATFESGRETINTRSKVLHLSWKHLVRQLETVYERLS